MTLAPRAVPVCRLGALRIKSVIELNRSVGLLRVSTCSRSSLRAGAVITDELFWLHGSSISGSYRRIEVFLHCCRNAGPELRLEAGARHERTL